MSPALTKASKRKWTKAAACRQLGQLRQLKQRLEMLEGVVAVMPGCVYWMNSEGVYLGCNNNEADAVGLASRKEIVGKRNSDMPGFWIPEALDPVNKEVFEHGREFFLEEPARLKNGTLATFLSNKVPIRDSAGEIIGMVGISFNITERKKQEKELQEAKGKAEAALKAKEIAEHEAHQKSRDLKKVLQDFTESRYYLSGKHQGIYLTKREAECLVCLPLGLSAKSIGEQLNISARTVEQYLDSIKGKLNCRTRAELIKSAIECAFLEGVKPHLPHKTNPS